MAENVKWSEGDQANFVAGHSMTVFPGLFFYSGFGVGWYYSVSGVRMWKSSTEAAAQARYEKVDLKFVDAFSGYVPTALGDR